MILNHVEYRATYYSTPGIVLDIHDITQTLQSTQSTQSMSTQSFDSRVSHTHEPTHELGNLGTPEREASCARLTRAARGQMVREERMGVLNKKQKQEEDKMRTNEESFTTQSKRLKEKLR